MNSKKIARERRAKLTRMKIREQGSYRLSVHRTLRHIYAQILEPKNNLIVVQASTLDKDLSAEIFAGNKKAAEVIGVLVAERAKAAGVTKVAFDRSGFKYHGRVKALADAARSAGLEF